MGLCPLFVFGGVVDRLDRVREIADRVARSQGLAVFDVQHRRESAGWVLRVVIDRAWSGGPDAAPERVEDSIGVAECQRVSDDIVGAARLEDVIDHAYTLEVSSPGPTGGCAVWTISGGSGPDREDRGRRSDREPDVFRGAD